MNIKKLKLYSLIYILIYLSGCSVIEIHDHNGNVSTHYKMGVIGLAFEDEMDMDMDMDIISLGLISTPISTTLGFSNQKIFISNNECNQINWR